MFDVKQPSADDYPELVAAGQRSRATMTAHLKEMIDGGVLRGDPALIGHMFIVARDLARQQGIAESGYRLIINCNAHGGQEVYHLHVHLLGGRPLGPMVARA